MHRINHQARINQDLLQGGSSRARLRLTRRRVITSSIASGHGDGSGVLAGAAEGVEPDASGWMAA